ncbi:hypothetical protein C8R43DRAFT_1118378 [Mycena crocata]|nr:hypothetical protein C8R43DRAFT_1118378 [Mycena crocata]
MLAVPRSSSAPLTSCFVTAVAPTPLDIAATANVVIAADSTSRLSVLVIAAHPPPPPTMTSTIPQPFKHLRSIPYCFLAPSSTAPRCQRLQYRNSSHQSFPWDKIAPLPSKFKRRLDSGPQISMRGFSFKQILTLATQERHLESSKTRFKSVWLPPSTLSSISVARSLSRHRVHSIQGIQVWFNAGQGREDGIMVEYLQVDASMYGRSTLTFKLCSKPLGSWIIVIAHRKSVLPSLARIGARFVQHWLCYSRKLRAIQLGGMTVVPAVAELERGDYGWIMSAPASVILLRVPCLSYFNLALLGLELTLFSDRPRYVLVTGWLKAVEGGPDEYAQDPGEGTIVASERGHGMLASIPEENQRKVNVRFNYGARYELRYNIRLVWFGMSGDEVAAKDHLLESQAKNLEDSNSTPPPPSLTGSPTKLFIFDSFSLPMHPCLRIPEIAGLICTHLDPPEIRSSPTILPCPSNCGSGILPLWRVRASPFMVLPLILFGSQRCWKMFSGCLPSDAWVMEGTEQDGDMRPLRPNAHLLVSGYFEYVAFDKRMPPIQSIPHPAQYHLAALGSCASIYRHLPQFSSLKSISIQPRVQRDSVPDLSSVLSTLVLKCPHLTDVHIDLTLGLGNSDLGPEAQAVSHFVCQWGCVKSLSVQVLDQDAFRRASKLSRLHSFAVNTFPPGFSISPSGDTLPFLALRDLALG